MLRDGDLEAAVAEGIVSIEQAAALRALADKRARAQAVALGHEERFHFMRSFNDFFFAIGVALLGGGLLFFTFKIPFHSLIAVLVIWALAELLVARMRLVLPGILLVCFFALFVVLASPIDFLFAALTERPSDFEALRDWFVTPRDQGPHAGGPLLLKETWSLIVIAYTGTGVIAAALFYLRFRLPFALLLVAGGLVCTTVGATYHYGLSSDRLQSFILLGCGIIVFLAAMVFDASDRERLTRRADCAFWLHLLAAPLIVHSLIELVWPQSSGSRLQTSLTTELAVSTALMVAVLAIVAIIIDRRALLVSALAYLGVAIGYAITKTLGQQGADNAVVFFATLVVLGAVVVLLGVGWRPLRRLLLSLLSPRLTNRLPPAATARPGV